MIWTGKVIGGLLGALVGGPVGAGVGVTVGHLVADGGRRGGIRIQNLHWIHHAFGPSGPEMRVHPEWCAVGAGGEVARVTVRTCGEALSAEVEMDAEDETVQLPEFSAPYSWYGDDEAAHFDVDIRARVAADRARFVVPLPSQVKRLGLSGPSRVVMALVGAARAGGAELQTPDRQFILQSFEASYALDAYGRAWLRAWLGMLADAAPSRLAAGKVASRLAPHVAEQPGPVLTWLWRGAEDAWRDDASVGWIEELGLALGLDEAQIAERRQEVQEGKPGLSRRDALVTLGVREGAEIGEIRAAWVRLARLHHPDRAEGADATAAANRRMARINAAWELLKG